MREESWRFVRKQQWHSVEREHLRQQLPEGCGNGRRGGR